MSFALLLVRLVVGLGLAAHGAQKLFGWFGGYGLQGTGSFMETLGFRPGRLFAFAAGSAELAGGLLVALGLLGPLGPALAVLTMIVAAVTVHLRHGFFTSTNGPELALLYAAGAVSLAAGGYGAWSLDGWLGLGPWSSAQVAAALVAGVVAAGLNLLARRPAPQPAAAAPTASSSREPDHRAAA